MTRSARTGQDMPEIAAVPVSDYALIGDTRTSALVSRAGDIDWMCVPRFDGDPLFGRLVDAYGGGSFSISVEGAERVSRSYRDESAILETTARTSTGTARLLEGMVTDVSQALLPQVLLVRRIECLAGEIQVRVRFDPRLGLPGRRPDRARRLRGHATLVCEWGSLAIGLLSTPDLAIEPGVDASLSLEQGQSLTINMSVADRSPLTFVTAAKANDLLDQTDRWWRKWSKEIDYEGPYRSPVVRSLITLRLLTYSPSGAPVAAPTTSLPETLGGSRNWDYRYAWPRDASIGLASFLATGNGEEAHSFMHWLLHASRLTRPRMRVLYGIYGRPAPRERELDSVSGYGRSLPVRVGNAAESQHQLDVYGWVLDAAWLLERSGHRLHGETWRAMVGFADFVAKSWREPDAGIWEVRGPPAQYVHSKLMAWLALDRALRIAATHRVRGSRTSTWRRERDTIAQEVRSRGVDQARDTYVWKYGSPDLDAALLILPVLDLEPVGSPLVKGTIEAVRRELEVEPGLLYRYRPQAEGLDGTEGVFLPCSFWLVQALARTGRVNEAAEVYERVLGYANDVELWSEEMDPVSKEYLGNYPQAFTHATLIQAALALRDAERPAQDQRTA